MADDLEAFLKRAAARRATQRKTGAPPVRRQAAVTPPLAAIPVQAEVVPPRIAIPTEQNIDREFADRDRQMDAATERLGRDVMQEDRRIETHLHDTFDHRVGQFDEDVGFAGDPSEPRPKQCTISADLIAMLRNPRSIQSAVLLSEILQRPEHRW